jgi:glycine/D-amino acid oxidase-like deaminating enzyme
MSRYVNINHNLDERYRSAITAPYGGMEIKEAGFVDVRKLVGAYRNYLRQKGLYRQEEVRYEEIIPTAAFVQWKEVQAKKIIFCDGAFTTQNPYFNWLPFSLVKGEIIHITIPDNSLEHIINQGIFILPLRNGVYKVGATYEWNELTWQPTLKAQEELLPKLKALLKLPFELVAHDAGIRPATADRRPLIGLHPHYQSVGIFNGLGTKGVSLAPYFARQLFEHLEYNKELPKEVYINRCFSLYYHSDNKLSI